MQIGFGIGIAPLSVHNVLGGFIGALDALSAAAAYSTRRLRTAYTGPLVRVRRSTDNVEADIGFGADGWLDQAALLAHVGAGNSGFVTTWYDQSGNGRNATQTTAASQPRIVNAGTYEGRLFWSTTTTLMDFSPGTTLVSASPATVSAVVGPYRIVGAALSTLVAWGNIGTIGQRILVGAAQNTANVAHRVVGNVAYGSLAFDTVNSSVFTFTKDATANANGTRAYVNGVVGGPPASQAIGAFSVTSVSITNGSNSLFDLNEYIFFNEELSASDRQTLERNQGTAFSITVA